MQEVLDDVKARADLADLHAGLDAALAFGPTWNGGLSNHLPMVLHAAWALGADGARLQGQLRHDAPRLVRAEPSALQRAIAGEIEADGSQAVLHRMLPWLVAMPHAGLFHGMIRTAHAWEGGHAGELAAALAYWAELWRSQPEVPPADELWRDCRQRLLDQALHAYLASGNFFVLHLITGLRALRVLARFVPDSPQVSSWLIHGFDVGWKRGNPELTLVPSASEPPAWPVLKQAALAQMDDHVIKLVHACWQEDCLRPDRRWRQAAAMAALAALTPSV